MTTIQEKIKRFLDGEEDNHGCYYRGIDCDDGDCSKCFVTMAILLRRTRVVTRDEIAADDEWSQHLEDIERVTLKRKYPREYNDYDPTGRDFFDDGTDFDGEDIHV